MRQATVFTDNCSLIETTISKQLTSIRSLNFQSQKSSLQVKEDEDSFIPLLQTILLFHNRIQVYCSRSALTMPLIFPSFFLTPCRQCTTTIITLTLLQPINVISYDCTITFHKKDLALISGFMQ
jgi:hypothetical protein